MSLDTLSNEDKMKLKRVVDEGVKLLQEIDDLKGGMKDTVKAVADDLNIKPAIINRAIRAALKANIDQTVEEVNDVEEVLTLTGHR